MSQQQWGHGYQTGYAEGTKQGETPPPDPLPFRLQTDHGRLNRAWNEARETCAGHEGPYVVLEHTNQRKCLRCLYGAAEGTGMVLASMAGETEEGGR